MANLERVFNFNEIQKHFELTIDIKFDIENEIIKDLNTLNYVLTVKNKPRKELKQIKKLCKVLNKMQKSGWNISNAEYCVKEKE